MRISPILAPYSYGTVTVALPLKNSEEWDRGRSKEVWGNSQTSTPCVSLSSPSTCVASTKNLKPVAMSTGEDATLISSSFLGVSKRFNERRTSRGQLVRIQRRPASMPLVEARLFGPSIFNASKLCVLLLGKSVNEDRPLQHPRIYTLTHSDVTAKITLAVAREINNAQVMGWYSQLQRDEVLAEWRRTQGETSLHVHCHVSGSNFLHKLIAKLRFYIFQKELPLVLEAFMHGDKDLFEKHPELQNAPVWVYFDSNVEEYNRVECWGPLTDAAKRGPMETNVGATHVSKTSTDIEHQYFPGAVCRLQCECCSRHAAVIPIPESLSKLVLLQSLSNQRQAKKTDSKSF